MTNKYLEKIASQSTEQRVNNVIGRALKINPGNIKPHHSFVKDLGAGNMSSVSIVMGLEDEFGKEIPDSVASHMTHVRHAYKYFGSKNRYLEKIAGVTKSRTPDDGVDFYNAYVHVHNLASKALPKGKISGRELNKFSVGLGDILKKNPHKDPKVNENVPKAYYSYVNNLKKNSYPA